MVKIIVNSIVYKDNKEIFLNIFLCENLLDVYKNNVIEIKLEY